MLELADVLRHVAANYSRINGGDGQQILERSTRELDAKYCPVGWSIRCSRRIGQLTTTPWLGFFDPEETTDPKSGLYVCWIIHEDMQWAAVSIQQGTESLTRSPRESVSIPERLRQDALALRRALPKTVQSRDFDDIDFGRGARQRRYAAGSIMHRRFALATLTESQATQATQEYCGLLELVVQARMQTLLRSPGALHQSLPRGQALASRWDNFSPKSADDYIAHLAATTQLKSRRHESIVNSYAAWATGRGWHVASPHPVDLRLSHGYASGRSQWADSLLFEAKVIRRGNVTNAVREVIGQLYTYPYMVVPDEWRHTITQAALFSQQVGTLWSRILEDELRIPTVWWGDGRWEGGPLAKSKELTD